MDFKQLGYFLSVAEYGSFSKAAVVLGVAQPVLSRQIRALEEEVGIELLYRNGRGIVLTEAGRVMQTHAKDITRTVALATSEVTALKSEPTGKLVLGVPPTVGSVLTVPLVQQFRAEMPKVSLKVIEGLSGHVLEWLSTGRIDVAVLYNAPKTSTLLTEPLIEEDLFLIGPARGKNQPEGREVTASALADLPLTLPGHPHGLRELVESALAKAGITPNVVWEIDAHTSMLQLAEDGVAYTILPYAAVHPYTVSGRLRVWEIVEPRISRQLVLATSTQRPVTQTTRALARLVRTQIRDLVAKGVWKPGAT
jgi:LysR family transcriptional regulator, nitrogen assimilation regulatory protein